MPKEIVESLWLLTPFLNIFIIYENMFALLLDKFWQSEALLRLPALCTSKTLFFEKFDEYFKDFFSKDFFLNILNQILLKNFRDLLHILVSKIFFQMFFMIFL